MRVLAVVVAGAACAAALQDSQEIAAVKPGDIKWEQAKNLPEGVMSVVIQGDPKKGPFILLLKMPSGTRVEPHWHSAAEVAVVQSGVVVLGPGEELDEAKGTELEAGSYFRIPAKTPHWGVVKKDAVLVRYGDGPADITYCQKK